MRSGRELGTVERLVYRTLKPRERVVAEFLCGERSTWSDQLKFAAFIVVVALPFGLLLGWSFALVMPIALGTAFTCFSGPWRGVLRRNAGGIYMPLWSAFPLDYREMFRVIYKIGAVRTVLTAPIATAGMAVPLLMMKAKLPVVLFAGLAWLAVLLIVQNGVVVILLNSFNLTPAFRWRRLPLYLLQIVVVLCPFAGIVLIAAAIFWPMRARLLTAGIGLIVLGSLLARYFYESLHRRGFVDPVSLTVSQPEETRLSSAEDIAEMEIRQELVRKQHGRFWWRERALRRWVWKRD